MKNIKPCGLLSPSSVWVQTVMHSLPGLPWASAVWQTSVFELWSSEWSVNCCCNCNVTEKRHAEHRQHTFIMLSICKWVQCIHHLEELWTFTSPAEQQQKLFIPVTLIKDAPLCYVGNVSSLQICDLTLNAI